ncbi:hypothetical protein PDESU_03701 [Pontiella desulfatans]|uniref:Uncharacterized protein n=1 Tax=Pontiella desulfatans TaxID=2750659 RepID=A0A6C2U6G7_PONDE|nr:hypothetical protein [Pontiella desulfatans]VGO15121.1 hypothetical protein PDESU_03701 [Pontiella desulfatans]
MRSNESATEMDRDEKVEPSEKGQEENPLAPDLPWAETLINLFEDGHC